jgi:outer membrane lipoprotein SlyB
MLKTKVLALATGAAVMWSTMAIADSSVRGSVNDHYHEVVYLEPYYVEVCGEETKMKGNVVEGAVWGAIFGSILGDVLNIDRTTGAVVGGMVGAKTEENKGKVNTTSVVCQTEVRQNKTTRKEYSHSTMRFEIEGNTYEVQFNKR